MPFWLSGGIPSYVDAFFETVSGFTTTGASVLAEVEARPRALLLWRSFSHWIGGMGILVFMLAIQPAARGKGESLHVLRAESPGPTIEKITPKIRHHAAILYAIYVVLTVLCFLFLLVGGMPLFDSACISFGTTATGGFGIRADSMASYGTYCQTVVTVFMLLSGVNFNIYFFLLLKRFKDAALDEELRAYLGVILASAALIAVNVVSIFGGVAETLHHTFFTVVSIITSTGFATVDFNLWPQFSRAVLLLLMIFGACAGSTGGGFKIIRIVLVAKAGIRGLRKMLHPRAVTHVKINGRSINETVLEGVYIYMTAYVAILIISFLLLSLDNFSIETNLSAVITCLNNIGPGLDAVGPMGSFYGFSNLSKVVLTADMLIGRLEIFPVLLLFSARSWNRAG
jgi:trk system potassium uptake protein TrkH